MPETVSGAKCRPLKSRPKVGKKMMILLFVQILEDTHSHFFPSNLNFNCIGDVEYYC